MHMCVCACVCLGGHTCGCVGVRPPLCTNLSVWTHSRELIKDHTGPGDARRLSPCVSGRHHSTQPVVLVTWRWMVLVLLSKRFRDTTGHKPPLLPKCKFIIITISATICAISTHLCAFCSCLHPSACFNRATPVL